MINWVFGCESGGSRIYRIGKVTTDSIGQDAGGIYTAKLKTERISPMGETGWGLFRRVSLRIWHTDIYEFTMTCFVDGKQTQDYSSGVLADQSQVFTMDAAHLIDPPNPTESWAEMSINGPGTYLEVLLEINVDRTDGGGDATILGNFLPAEMEVHFVPMRRARERGTGVITGNQT